MENQVRLTGPSEAAPELACLRVIAQLPPRWSVRILECGTGYAVLGLCADASAEEVAVEIDEAITALPLRGWKRS